MAYQMAATAVTLNDFRGHQRLQAFSNAIRRAFMQHFTPIQLTVCWRSIFDVNSNKCK